MWILHAIDQKYCYNLQDSIFHKIYRSSFDEMDKKIPIEVGIFIPILIALLIMTPFIHQKKKELNLVHLSKQTFKAKNQNTPDHESLTLYFIVIICFILVVVFINLCNG